MKRYLLLTTLLALCFLTMAAPLKNIEVRITQPDGQIIHCFASGDEFYNYLHDANGFTIVQGEGGYYYYAIHDTDGNVIPSAYTVNSVDPATAGLKPYVKISEKEYYTRRQQREQESQVRTTKSGEQIPLTSNLSSLTSKKFPNGRELNHGLYNNLVVFIRFAGDTYHTSSFSTVQAMFNADGYEDNSLHNYYHHTSYNQIDLWSHFYPQPDGEIILSYEDIYPKQYYQPYNPVTNPMGYQDGETADREFSMLERAINYIEDMVPDTLDLDYNSDGLVDNVVFVIKGEPGEWASLLWPHRWCIYDRYVPLHDLQVYDFNLQLEQGGYFNVSTLCHEMFHSLGAPDLYHYTSGIDPVGSWDLMCGTTEPPQQTNTYMKYKYGNWVDDIPVISESPDAFGTYELEAVSWEGGRRNGYMIPLYGSQSLFIEYRNKNNVFESQIPGSGLLIYRIDKRYDGNASWNGYDYYDEVYLFRPEGTVSNAGELNLAYFSQESGRTEFNNSTSPKPFLNPESSPYFDWGSQITNISETGDKMSFVFRPYNGEGSAPGPEHFVAHVNSFEHQVELSWNAAPYDCYYYVYRDGMEIANVTDTTFIHPYSATDNGYHMYSVVTVDAGLMHVYSAESKAWVILGDYETIDLEITSDSPFGTKGGELEVTFNNPAMKSQYFTIYEGYHAEGELHVPASTDVSFRWHSGFDPESHGIQVTATHRNGNGQWSLFSTENPEEGLLATYTAQAGALGFIHPQHLTATPDENGIQLYWTMPAENHEFNIYRDGVCVHSSWNGYEYLDDQLTRSGTHSYNVSDAHNSNWYPEDQVTVTAMTFSCEPPQNLEGVHHEGSQPYNELTWEAPQFVGHGMLAYDDNTFVDQMGSKTQKFGIKILPGHLSWFEGLPLTHLEMFDCSAGTYTFKIYSGENVDNDHLLYSQSHEMTGSQEFVRFALDEEVPFDVTLPLWICVEPNNVNNPAPYGNYIGNPNSCMVRVSGQWRPITYYSQYLSWLLRAYTCPADKGRDVSYKVYAGPEEGENHQMNVIFDGLSNTSVTHNNAENTRYNVTAIWNGKETEFSNSIFLGPSVAVEEEIVPEQESFAYINNGNIIICCDASNASIQMVDMTGRIVLVCRDAMHCVSTAGMTPGVYVLRLINGDNVKTQKIVVN